MRAGRQPQLVLTLVASALLLAGCETQPLLKMVGVGGSSSSSSGSIFSKTVVPANAPLPEAASREWADAEMDVNSYRVAGWGLVSMPAMQAYLNKFYASVKAAGGKPDWPGSVYILADPALRATSTAAGNVFISLGWLRTISSEDEMSALLAHEFGHVYLNHHAGHEVGNTADTVSWVSAAIWMIVNRKVPSVGMNGVYAISGVRALGSGVAMPAWQRSQEGEADHFGTSLSLRQGYSYTQGFKLFLEHIESYDSQLRGEAAAAAQVATENARKQVTQTSTEQAKRMQDNGKDVTGLSKKLGELQVTVSESAFDIQTAIAEALGQAKGKVTDNHDSAASREDELSKAVIPLIAGKPRPVARVDVWKAAMRQSETAEVLDKYALLPGIDEALARKNFTKAQQLSKQAASGLTANDALPLYYQQMVFGMNQPGYTLADVYFRHAKAKERSWKFELMLASMVVRRDKALGREIAESQFNYFRKAPPAWPDMIVFYRENGFIDQARALSRDCALSMPSYRTVCIDSAKTDSEKAAEQAAADRKTKQVVDKMFKKK